MKCTHNEYKTVGNPYLLGNGARINCEKKAIHVYIKRNMSSMWIRCKDHRPPYFQKSHYMKMCIDKFSKILNNEQ